MERGVKNNNFAKESKNFPFRNLTPCGMMRAETKTDVTVLLAGTQHMDAPIVLSGEENPEWKKLRLTFRSEDESFFTSLVEIKGKR